MDAFGINHWAREIDHEEVRAEMFLKAGSGDVHQEEVNNGGFSTNVFSVEICRPFSTLNSLPGFEGKLFFRMKAIHILDMTVFRLGFRVCFWLASSETKHRQRYPKDSKRWK